MKISGKKIGMSRFVDDSGKMIPCTILRLDDAGKFASLSNYDFVDVSAKSIGKGFAGPMKRHNFGGLPATHGVSISHRSHGSTGQCQDPGKTFRGKKMAGHMGNKNVTIQNLRILYVDSELNCIAVKGAVPGHGSCRVCVKRAVKKYGSLSKS